MAVDSRSQELQWRAAPVVCARGWPWARRGITEHGPVAVLHVAPTAEDAPDLDALLVPIDRVSVDPPARRARRVSRRWLRRWIATWPVVAWPSVEVAAPIDASVAILPHQLAPVLAVVRGEGTRLLIADPVGQGKTIEAGLLIRELAARGAAERVLILTPATLRDQWRRELSTRCRIEASVLDRPELRRRTLDDPQGAGPFRRPGVSICSADLAKQADVLASLAAQTWDVLVVDEAHTVAGDSSRTAAVRAIGDRARVIALLTATPHSGDPGQFARLCAIGAPTGGPPPLWFRRPRPAIGQGARPRARDVRVGRSPAERRLASALRRYLRRLDATKTSGGRLVAVVLRKRALSSPAALAASLRHRIAWLEGRAPAHLQPALPFDLADTSDDDARQPAALAEPGLVDPAAERDAARAALRLAEVAIGSWSKRRVLERLLRRTRERVLVFTEYRDTLEAVARGLARVAPVAVLHGGLDRGDRERALDRFAAGAARVLVATDVAAEGLNLQSACRLVVHVELPWTPVRLEQRNGRVDRLGQSRRVHVWRLLGEAAHEARVLSALAARVARMRADGVEVSTTGLAARVQPQDGPVTTPPGVAVPRAGEAAIAAARAAELLRALLRGSGPRDRVAGLGIRRGLPWRRVRPRPLGLPRGVTIVCLAPASGVGSRPALLAIHVALRSLPPGPPEEWLPHVALVAAASVPTRREPLVEALRAREEAMLARARDDRRRLDGRWQASLFEQRAARVVSAARDRAARLVDDHVRRLAAHAAPAPPPVPVLALLVE